jgi:hypothetical protein
MRIFHCDHCQQLVFFENVKCLACGHALAFLPDLADIGSLEPLDNGLFRSPAPEAAEKTYRLCQNYTTGNVCNWAIPADDPDPLCQSCRLSRIVPDDPLAWYRLEVAKRRLIYNLMALGLPIVSKGVDPERGLAFEFLADPAPPTEAVQSLPESVPSPPESTDTPTTPPPVLTGHAHGLITINVAEVDDVERERRRKALHEPYRTLLGHFRHEVGHYYWDLLVQGTERIEPFRSLFGDERQDYAQALERHYQQPPQADWQDSFISAYAASHPWEDWAETWAHYLHMADALETAGACGLSLRPQRSDEPVLKPPRRGRDGLGSFDQMIGRWFPLTYVLNALNRGLGLPDSYPFILSQPVIAKLRFVHESISAAAG